MENTITILILSCISFGIYGQNLEDKLNIFKQSFTSSSTEAVIRDSGDDNCVCIPIKDCKERFGQGVITLKAGDKCHHYLEDCCKPAGETDRNKTDSTTRRPVQGCGYRNLYGVGFRIIGDSDNETQFGEFPWMVAVMTEEVTSRTSAVLKSYKCGGALVHASVVVTAAHCVISRETKYMIRAGEWDTQTTNELFPYQERHVKKVVTHKDFISGTAANDIAILFLDKPVEIIDNVNTLCLPEQDVDIQPGTRCFATGWGKVNFGEVGIYATILKKIDLPIVDHATCQNLLRTTKLGKKFELHKSFICAGGEGKDTCKGDGGGPLICPTPGHENKYQHIGIVAWGVGCGEENVPGVNANVGMFRNWIDEQMSSHGLDTSG